MALIEEYKAHTAERAELGVPPLALTADQAAELVELLKASPIAEQDFVMDMFENKVPAGVDDAAYVKAAFLNDIVQGNASCDAIDAVKACEILGSMLGGFNVNPLVEALKLGGEVADVAAEQLKNTILVYDAFNDVEELTNVTTISSIRTSKTKDMSLIQKESKSKFMDSSTKKLKLV